MKKKSSARSKAHAAKKAPRGTTARKSGTTARKKRSSEAVSLSAPKKRTVELPMGSQDAQVYADVSTEVLADQIDIDTTTHGERHPGRDPELSAGDVDAAWDEADVGDETVGGSSPTPDQDQVDAIGKALGVSYSGTEPLHTTEKIEQRDDNRWELDPASAEDYGERVKEGTRRGRRSRARP